MNRIAAVTAPALLALVAISSSGCIYLNVAQPLDTNLERTQLGNKVGKSEARSILGLVAWGDASTRAAAEDGGITTIAHADQENFALLGFVYTRYRTVVYGE